MNGEIPVILVVAVAENGVIGRDGAMPWKLSSDLKRFKADTMGKPVIMGRKTFEAIGKPLPGRLNIVVTRDYDWEADGVLRAGSLEGALDIARAHCEAIIRDAVEAGETVETGICVIGGGQIYAQAMDRADELRVTHVLAEIDGDTVFPPIDPAEWKTTLSEDYPAGEKDSHATRYAVYRRRD